MANRVDPEVLNGFLEEAKSYLPGMSQCLERLRHNLGDREALQEMHRLAHNIRGSSSVVGLPEVAQLAEGLEALLDQVNEGAIVFDEELAELVAEGVAQIAEGLAPETRPAPVPASAASSRSLMEEAAGELIDGFLLEAEEHLQVIGSNLDHLEQDPTRKPLLQEIRRSVHTIKGAAGMVGLKPLSQIAHRMEDLLDRLYEGTAAFTNDVLQLLFATYDLQSDIVTARGSTEGYGSRIQAIYDAYSGILGRIEPEQTLPVSAPPASARAMEAAGLEPPEAATEHEHAAETGPEASKYVRVPLERLDQLVRLVGELFVQRSAFEQQLTQYDHELEELKLSLQRLKRISNTFDNEHATFNPGGNQNGNFAAILNGGLTGGLNSAPNGAGSRAEFDALEFDRYTQLHLLSRDLNETASDVSTCGAQLKSLGGGFDSFVSRQGRLTSEIQDKLMRLRMVPLSTLANRLNRTVRVTANECAKLANLTIEGAATELDKTVLEQLAGPLEHLLRNAIDHGIEAPEARMLAGKPMHGEIRLRAAQEGTEVLIRLSDDGGGIDYTKLRETAVRTGLLTAAEAAESSEERLSELLFLPGVSTAAELSDISGRGIGLDIVRSSVEALNGSLQVKSEPGSGSLFTIRLPMTMAITKVLMLQANQETFALPLSAISVTARVQPHMVRRVDGKETVEIDRKTLPVVRLGDSFQLRGAPLSQSRGIPVLAIKLGETEYALLVDDIHEAREVVVKPLTGIVRRVPGVAGATILGNGSVVLLLNPAELPGRVTAAVTRPPVATVRRALAARRAYDVLIVDDSLSVRRVIANLMRATGWNPVQAKDGVEALETLGKLDRRPDIILMDIEMPRMDGFELTSRLRSMPDYRNTPIVMLTSRAGDKHRSKAMSLGVTEYFVKPYQDDSLLAAIRRHVEISRRAMQVA